MQTYDVPKFDPNLFTGPARLNAGIARVGTVTPGTPYGEVARWLYVGVGGNVSILLLDGSAKVMSGLSAGVWHPIYSLGVNVAGTTATGMLWGS